MKENSILILVGIIVGLVILSNYDPELFSVSATSPIVFSGKPTFNVKDCYKGNTVTKIEGSGTRYKIYTTPGCKCQKVLTTSKKGNTNITILISDSTHQMKNYELVNYAKQIHSNLLSISPLSNYKYDIYLENNTGDCTQFDSICNDSYVNRLVLINAFGSPDTGGQSNGNIAQIIYSLKDDKFLYIHELGHNLGLPDESSGGYVGACGVNKNIMCYTNPTFNFNAIQKNIIINFLKNYKQICLNSLQNSQENIAIDSRTCADKIVKTDNFVFDPKCAQLCDLNKGYFIESNYWQGNTPIKYNTCECFTTFSKWQVGVGCVK